MLIRNSALDANLTNLAKAKDLEEAKAKLLEKNAVKKVQQKEKKATTREEKHDPEANNIKIIQHVPTTSQVLSIVWCNRANRFIKKHTPNHIPFRLEVESLHKVQLEGNGISKPSEKITKQFMQRAVDNTNCLDTGASITLAG